MLEHGTKAVVLDKEGIGDLDGSYLLFTKEFGKIYARATSSRKPTSKLAGHLEPGTYSRIRLAQRTAENGYRLIEALTEGKLADKRTIDFLNFINQMTPVAVPEDELFDLVEDFILGKFPNEKTAYRKTLKILGFDPDEASCGVCGNQKIAYFSSQDIIFLCRQCGERLLGRGR